MGDSGAIDIGSGLSASGSGGTISISVGLGDGVGGAFSVTAGDPLIPDASNKCEICPSGKDWYAQVEHDGKSMTCLELDTVLLKQRVFEQLGIC
jgi:hypothetical protein